MEVYVQNAQLEARRKLPTRDVQGRPRCFLLQKLWAHEETGSEMEQQNIVG